MAAGVVAALPASAWRLQPVGLQLYTVREQMKADFDGTLAAVAKVGYGEVEFAGYFGRTPSQVKASLSRAGLVAPSAHIPVEEVLERMGRDARYRLGDRAQVPGGGMDSGGDAKDTA